MKRTLCVVLVCMTLAGAIEASQRQRRWRFVAMAGSESSETLFAIVKGTPDLDAIRQAINGLPSIQGVDVDAQRGYKVVRFWLAPGLSFRRVREINRSVSVRMQRFR